MANIVGLWKMDMAFKSVYFVIKSGWIVNINQNGNWHRKNYNEKFNTI